MNVKVSDNEVFGLIRPDVDVHTLGISTIGKLIADCGYKVHIGDAEVSAAIARISKLDNISLLINWIFKFGITRLGFSYRLDPKDAQNNFGKVFSLLKDAKAFKEQGGPINMIYFAGLPTACKLIELEYDNRIPVFHGDETQMESIIKMGIPEERIPKEITEGSKYDDERIQFATEFIKSGKHKLVCPAPKPTYPNFGSKKDTIYERVLYNRKVSGLPLMRVHVGPYYSNYIEAKKEFISWLKRLSSDGFLDIVSVGSSQLSQSDFGLDWGDKPNGGGVPINSEQDLIDIYDNSRPMLVRTYAGTRNIPKLAEVYERTINIAWHALSFWWFNKIDGRGPYDVKTNLQAHYDTLKVIASSSKPFEPNIPHHFSFRGGDDFTYVLSSVLAAKTAKSVGVKAMVIQTMLNTPKYTWGVQDLAKARALLKLVRELEDEKFRILLQPRAGLDYFSPDLEKAKIQLAAVSAMMDDIEPENLNSPDMIHVVSYCEAVELATPDYINESIQITKGAISEYRDLKKKGLMDNMIQNSDVDYRMNEIIFEVKEVIKLIEKNIDNPYTPDGLYEIFKLGIMPVPYLWEGKEEFKEAIKWKTSFINGGIKVVNELNKEIKPSERVRGIFFSKNIGKLN
jgi:hypothetical protein